MSSWVLVTACRLALFGVFTAPLAGCRDAASEPRRNAEPIPSSAITAAGGAEATFAIKHMTCASCNETVEQAARSVPGVVSARADATQQRAWVRYDPARTTPEQIAAVIGKSGYPASVEQPTGAASAAPDSRAVAPKPPPAHACHVMREGIFLLWPKLGRAPRAREIAKELGLKETEVESALAYLDADDTACAGRIERPKKSDRIVFAWPLSNLPTEYVVELDGAKPVFSRCAVDALGMSAMYGKRATITATSIGSGTQIRIVMDRERVIEVTPKEAVVWVGTSGCDEMLLFANRAELDAWRAELGKPEGRTGAVDDAAKYGVEVFGRMLRN